MLVVRGARYQPELIAPDGTRRRGVAIAHAPYQVTPADRSRHLRTVVAEMESRLRREAGGGGGRVARIPRVEAEEPDAWPRYRPPVDDATIRVDSRQRGWVRVADPAWPDVERYDLLDTLGRRVGAVRLPARVRLVGMGKDVLYSVREDEDGLLHLQRHPLP